MTESKLVSDLKSQNEIIDECYRFLHMKMRLVKDKKESQVWIVFRIVIIVKKY